MTSPSMLNINSSLVAFSDTVASNNPRLKVFDWTRWLNGIQVNNPRSEQFVVPARSTVQVFNGTRATTIAANSAFTLTYLEGSTYRFSYTGGTDPTFAVNVPLTFTARNLTVVTNANQTITITDTTSSNAFTGLAADQTVYIYDTVDTATPAFNGLNSGFWIVLSATAAAVILARPEGTPFSSFDETLTAVNAANNMIAFTPSMVQVGDTLRVTGGFVTSTQNTYTVLEVTSKWVDVVSTYPLATEVGVIPGTANMVFYSAGKRFVRVECDQRARLYFNGAVDNSQEIEPWEAGNPQQVGWNERTGPVWSLSVYNAATVPAVFNVLSCE